ncbi:MAG: zf-HC2 domain-containing protein [Acidobacteriota bacterium]
MTPSSSCRELREDLLAYLDGELDDAAGARMQDHLDGCSACFHLSELDAGLRPALREAVPPTNPSPELEARVLRRLLEQQRRASRRPATRSSRLRRGLVGAVLAALVFALVAQLQGSDGRPSEEPAPLQLLTLEGVLRCPAMELYRRAAPTQAERELLPTLPGLPTHLGWRLDTEDRGWTLVVGDTLAASLSPSQHVGRRVAVVGVGDPEMGALRVARLRIIEVDAARDVVGSAP